MGSVIKKTPNSHGTYRYIRHINVLNYPSVDWEHDPDISGVANVLEHHWKYDGTNVVVEMSQVEKDAVNADLNDYANPVLVGTFAFEKSGTCRNKWIGFGSSKSSDRTPFIIPNPTNVTAITFINQNNSVETDIEIYKNGTKIHTWELRDKRWAWKTKGLYALTFQPGDRVGIYLRDQGTNPRHVVVTLHCALHIHEVGEGGSSTL